MLTVKKVAEMLGVSSALVYALAADGRLPSYRIGLRRGALRFTLEDVESYLKSCRTSVARMPRTPLKHIKM